ncbi:uncharacterized protein LOC116200390 [Punica granatum]|uniref:S-protein homolog n=2 Tax=Punica granatum TaxID=22663 RepID=A0A218WBH1_PUNGR|nr:uncharacterized protein LOC116200390 [Punica granatum]OWM69432.1 hypothetical protein CDL15_Pgr013893 [Punica granatum]PKI72631.1 hypothetical protein CRG98_007008 [Punica granatum]
MELKPNLLFSFFFSIFLIATTCASVSGILVHTFNQLGNGKVLNVHCTLDLSTDMGAHDIPDSGSYEWSFSQEGENGSLLECDASTKGAANVLHFAGYLKSRDACTSNCDWRFTDKGVFRLVDGQWRFHFSWP